MKNKTDLSVAAAAVVAVAAAVVAVANLAQLQPYLSLCTSEGSRRRCERFRPKDLRLRSAEALEARPPEYRSSRATCLPGSSPTSSWEPCRGEAIPKGDQELSSSVMCLPKY